MTAMPGFLCSTSARRCCAPTAGQAQPTAPNPRVTVMRPADRDAWPTPYVVAGCALPPPPAGNGPCVTAQWVSAATRVTVERAAGAAARQPGDLRADRDAAD